MAALSFRDRLLTRRGARAILSPIGIVGGVAVAAVAVVAGLPVVAGALVGVGVWAVNAGRLLPRAPRAERIDPFTLQEPWRRFVQEALQARTRFAESLQVQRATAERLDAVIDKAQSELRLLDARLDEAVARTLELAAHASTEAGTGVIGLSTDVDNLVSEMESLRLALDETSAAAQRGTTPGTPRDLPPGGAR